MSEASQPVEPDLHAIFGMDGEQRGDAAVSLEGDGGDPQAANFDPFAPDVASAVEIDLDTAEVEEADWATEKPPPPTPPPRRARAAGPVSPSPRAGAPRHAS